MDGRVRNELTGMIDDALGDDAKSARRDGYDWGRISRLLGITRQWARTRFKDAPPRLPPHAVAESAERGYVSLRR